MATMVKRGRRRQPKGDRKTLAARLNEAMRDYLALPDPKHGGPRTTSGLAEALGVRPSTVSGWKKGVNLPSDWTTWRAIARETRVSTDWLFGLPDAEKAPASFRREEALENELAAYVAERLGVSLEWARGSELLNNVLSAEVARIHQYREWRSRWGYLIERATQTIPTDTPDDTAGRRLLEAEALLSGVVLEALLTATARLGAVRPPDDIRPMIEGWRNRASMISLAARLELNPSDIEAVEPGTRPASPLAGLFAAS